MPTFKRRDTTDIHEEAFKRAGPPKERQTIPPGKRRRGPLAPLAGDYLSRENGENLIPEPSQKPDDPHT